MGGMGGMGMGGGRPPRRHRSGFSTGVNAGLVILLVLLLLLVSSCAAFADSDAAFYLFILLIIVAIVVLLIVKKRQDAKEKEDERMERMMNTPLESFGDEKDAHLDDLEKKYAQSAGVGTGSSSSSGTPKRFCTKCGAAVEPGQAFCGSCGAKLGGSSAGSSPSPDPSAQSADTNVNTR